MKPLDLMKAALEEQVRREATNPTVYRPDQRERAIQQRLSRLVGDELAFAPTTSALIRKEISAHAVLGPRHRGE